MRIMTILGSPDARVVKWLNGWLAGHWFVGGCTNPEAIGEDVQAQAVKFAKRVIDGIK